MHCLISSNVLLKVQPSTVPSGGALTKPDAISTVPTMVRGDWVLFHPVYSVEELKSVEVCLENIQLLSVTYILLSLGFT